MTPTIRNMEQVIRLRLGVAEDEELVEGEDPWVEVEANIHKATSLHSLPEHEAR